MILAGVHPDPAAEHGEVVRPVRPPGRSRRSVHLVSSSPCYTQRKHSVWRLQQQLTGPTNAVCKVSTLWLGPKAFVLSIANNDDSSWHGSWAALPEACAGAAMCIVLFGVTWVLHVMQMALRRVTA